VILELPRGRDDVADLGVAAFGQGFLGSRYLELSFEVCERVVDLGHVLSSSAEDRIEAEACGAEASVPKLWALRPSVDARVVGLQPGIVVCGER
jgi:hypothetical protein